MASQANVKNKLHLKKHSKNKKIKNINCLKYSFYLSIKQCIFVQEIVNKKKKRFLKNLINKKLCGFWFWVHSFSSSNF
jgi:hypothetical protein